uniref:Globin family profile domain-containing protein n=1 Tax=Panagrolaimus sp. ES5 TaxID=591445 RepID=A0AC34FUM5_9BILA
MEALCCGGCSTWAKMFGKKTHETELTPDEIEAVREVWQRAKNHDIGRKILSSLIERRPKFAEYFGITCSVEDGIDLRELNKAREFQLQAHRIQGFLDTAVGSLGYCPLTSIYDMAHRIGQIHFYRGVNFGADNWLVFKKVAVDQVTTIRTNQTSKQGSALDLLSKDMSTEKEPELNPYAGENCIARLGWNKLMTVIVREMKRGFLEEAMRNCKEEEPIV